MNAKLYSLIMAAFLWCLSSSEAETPLAYLQAPFPAINQQSFAQGGGSGFGLSAPSSFSATGYAPSRMYLPKKAYIQQKLYQLPLKYNLQGGDLGLATEKAFEEEYHHEPAHYEFHYNIHDPHHGTEFGHKEYRDGHVAKGQYIVLLPDGRRQIVDYIADAHGYRPTIRYETGFGYR